MVLPTYLFSLSALRLVDDDSDDICLAMEKVAKHIVRECKKLKPDGRSYDTRINLDEAMECCSQTLLSLLKLVSTKLDSSMSATLIGNMVTNMITNHPTML